MKKLISLEKIPDEEIEQRYKDCLAHFLYTFRGYKHDARKLVKAPIGEQKAFLKKIGTFVS